MKLKMHSFSDVITNSSTSIYVQTGSKGIESMKELINMFLSYSGSEKKADDLFDFKIEVSENTIERIWDQLGEDEEDNKFGEDIERIDAEKDYTKRHDLINKFVLEKIESGEIKVKDYESDYGYNEDYLIMIPKENTQETINLTHKFEGIFDIDATYN